MPEHLQGYSHLAGDTFYRLVSLGTGGQEAKRGDYLTVLLRYSTSRDSLFFEGGRRFQLGKPSYEGAIEQCFQGLHEGDSAVFMLSAHDFFTHSLASALPPFFDSGEYVRVDVRMLGISDSLAFAREKEAFLHWVHSFGDYERVILKRYMTSEHLRPVARDSIFYLSIAPGRGMRPLTGDTLTLDFEGRFFDGTFFDSTIKRGQPFQFVLGQSFQVIEGLERAVRMMRPGERALFIIPSTLAFGAGGSSTGIVPPYTPVLFEVKLLECRRGV